LISLKIDYSGKDVIPANFVAILTGGKSVVTATDGTTKAGKVLKSTKDDNVFVNFVDHGGVNVIGFPETIMHATDLVSALKTSHERGLFKQMVRKPHAMPTRQLVADAWLTRCSILRLVRVAQCSKLYQPTSRSTL